METMTLTIPGTETGLRAVYREGRLHSLHAAGRDYLTTQDDERVFDGGFVRVREVMLPGGMLRHVTARQHDGRAVHWVETYRLDALGRPAFVDGVTVRRDERHRIIACKDGEVTWRYHYRQERLAAISGPFGKRHIGRDANGAPREVRVRRSRRALPYRHGRRSDIAPRPENWHCDAQGRLWTVCNAQGRIVATYLWDGFACLGRIDGPPGEPLAAVFSLDPSLTPVRVISRSGVTRIPRDAFGEGLLAHDGVPGLHGGAVYQGAVYQRSRALDPRTGAYDAPDPWHGGAGDARRRDGYLGALLSENTPGGPYTVCHYDPLTFVDPTGEISFPYMLSSITWSMQNNYISWLGMLLTINFWGAFFSGNFDRMFNFRHISSDRLKVGAIQADGVLAGDGGAFTTQHLVWSKRDYWDGKADIFCFDPQGEFRPNLYGTLLHVDPDGDDHDPFILRGMRNRAGGQLGEAWTRSGGPAAAVIPGSQTPIFPSGGFHFNKHKGLRGPHGATMTELEPGGPLGLGTLQDFRRLTIGATGLGLAVDDLLLLTGAGSAAAVVRILSVSERGAQTNCRIDLADDPFGGAPVRVRGVSTPVTENAQPVNGQRSRLDLLGTANAYAVGNVLRLTQGANVVVLFVNGFEARIQIEEALPSALTSPFNISAAQPGLTNHDAQLTAGSDILDFPTGPVPNVGDAIRVTQGAVEIVVVITELVEDEVTQRRVDRNLFAVLDEAVPDVNWNTLTRGVDLGNRTDAVESATDLTYTPRLIRNAPNAGYLLATDGSMTVVRRVTGRAYDGLVLSGDVPGDTINPYGVERFLIQAPDQSDAALAVERLLALDPVVNLGGSRALALYRLFDSTGPGPAPALADAVSSGRTAIGGVTVAADRATHTFANATDVNRRDVPRPSQFVVLRNPAGDLEGAIVSRVRLTVTLDREITVNDTGVEAVLLAPPDSVFDAVHFGGAMRVTLSGPPPFSVGDTVNVSWAPGGPNQFWIAGSDGFSFVTVGHNAGAPPVTLTLGGTVANGTVSGNLGISVRTRLAGGGRSQLPQFRAGDLIEADWGAAAENFEVSDIVDNDVVLTNPGGGDFDVDMTVRPLGSPRYDAQHLGPLTVDFGGAPPLAVGDVVSADFSGSNTHELRIAAVEGTTLGLTAGAPQPVRLTTGGGAVHNPVSLQPLSVTVLPTVAGQRVEMPQFYPGELVQVVWTNATPNLRVTAVTDNEATLVPDGDELGPLLGVTVQRLIPAGASTGGSRLGINGEPVGGTAVDANQTRTDQIAFDVWQPDHFGPDALVAILFDNQNAWPARVDGAAGPQVEITFTAAPATVTGGGVAILNPDVQAADVALDFDQEGAALTIHDTLTVLDDNPPPDPDTLVAAVPYQNSERSKAGQLHAGSTLVPEDPENWEFDRYQALVEHELRHTQQYLWWGPLWFTFFPAWLVFDIPLAAIDASVELPDYSEFVPATLARESADDPAAARYLSIPNMQGIAFAEGDVVQVGSGQSLKDATLGPLREGASNAFRVRDLAVPDGDVFVRRRNRNPAAWYEVLANIIKAFTPGSLLNTSIGLTYGTMYQIIGRLIYFFIRLGTRDTTYPATVEDEGAALQLQNAADRTHFASGDRILVQSGDSMIVRSAQNVAEDGRLTLSAPLTFSDTVQVAPYSARSPRTLLDWRKYYPATIVPDRPAAIRVEPLGDDSLSLEPFDRVMVLADDESTAPFINWDSVVTAVDGDIVELADPPPSSGPEGGEQTLRVAKIGKQDPLGWWDSRFLDEWAELGWVRWITDPFAQIHTEVAPERGKGLDIFLRSLRYIFGTSNWSMLPVFGWVWYDRFFPKGDGNFAYIEQDASEQSGELYTPLTRLHGDLQFVGDVARFWFFDKGEYVIRGGEQDAPGVHLRQDLRLLPFVTAETNSEAVNHGAGAGDPDTTSPGRATPDALTIKNAANLVDAPALRPRSLGPSDRAWLPVSPTLQMNSGIYVAFNRPGNHRLSLSDDISDGAEGRAVHDRGRQTILFNRTLQDVTVRVNGLVLAEGDTLPLLQTQRATVQVEPAGERRYRLALQRPNNGALLRREDERVLVAQTHNGAEAVDVVRFHSFDGTSFGTGVLNAHGVHLPRSFFISVRGLNVEVVNTLPVLATLPDAVDPATIYSDPPAQLAAGAEVFVLVPSNVIVTRRPVVYTVAPPPPDPLPTPSFADVTGDNAVVNDAVRSFVGEGRVFRLTLAEDDAPVAAAQIEFEADVGVDGNRTTLTINISLMVP
jgi:hypothetical protein